MRPCSVEAKGLSAGYRDHLAIRGVNLEIPEGSMVAVLGPNGAGKTTLLRVLAGIINPTEGQVRVCGRPPREARGLIGYAPATPEVDPRLRGVEVALLFRYGVSRRVGWGRSDWEAARRSLEELGVEDLAEVVWGEMSSGQRRLVILAGVLSRGSGLLLLDEPHSFLDISNKLLISRVLGRLRKGSTVIYTTHDPLLAIRADIAVVMKDGRIHVKGPPRSVITERTLEDVYGVPAIRVGEIVVPKYF
ncbi:MAG: ABC transporter ATP-binding protein [Aeropyrum sp.]|nr:ABC transporter ATP-binding protein [Aeropyrum sp.]